MEYTITVSEALYRVLRHEAVRRRRSPDELAEEMLAQELLPQHPHIEQVTGRGGVRAVIRGTRVGVWTKGRFMGHGGGGRRLMKRFKCDE